MRSLFIRLLVKLKMPSKLIRILRITFCLLKCTIMYCVNYWQETRPGLLYYIVSRVVPNHASTALRRVTSSFSFVHLLAVLMFEKSSRL